MAEFCKINTLFKRDAKNVIIPWDFAKPEFEYLRPLAFEATEKIDGTNTRIEIHGGKVEFGGRTDKAEIPKPLLDRLVDIFSGDTLTKFFGSDEWTYSDFDCTIYGEGYGNKIQKVGKDYISTGVDFILFDVKIGRYWLKREAVEEMGKRAGIKVVPYVGDFTMDEAVEFVKKGFKSKISENVDLKAEGLVLRPKFGILNRDGSRIIFKVKTCDFEKFNSVYGEGYTGPQPVNTKYVQQ